MTISAGTILIGDCRAIRPTEKPSGMIEILARTSHPPCGLVGVWFAGSGSVGKACRLSGHLYPGCEIDAEMAERARSRIAGMPFHDGGAA